MMPEPEVNEVREWLHKLVDATVQAGVNGDAITFEASYAVYDAIPFDLLYPVHATIEAIHQLMHIRVQSIRGTENPN